MTPKFSWVLFLALLLSACTTANHPHSMARPKQTAQTLDKKISQSAKAKYLLFLPDGYDSQSTRWPLILFLHGIGERGNDPWKVKVHGPPKVAEKMSNFPFIVVSPQCPSGEWWSTD